MTQDMGYKITTKQILSQGIFPAWEQNIPSLEKKCSQLGNIQPGSGRLLRILCLVCLLLVGVSGVKAQETPDYSGIYYIASNGNAYEAGTTKNLSYTYDPETPSTNFYLRPAADPQIDDKTDAFFDGTDETKPFLTSNNTGHTDIALWILEKTNISYTITTPSSGVDYYYTIRHVETGKYLVCDPYFASAGTLGDKNNSRRKAMHLETKDWTTTIPDKALFKIRYTKDESTGTDNFDSYCFIPKRVENKDYKYLNLADRNQPVNYGTKADLYYGGLAGLYTLEKGIVDINSRFKFEPYVVAQPTITFNNATNEVTITATEGSIYYTTNDDTPTSELTAYSSPVTFTQTTPCSIKAIAVKSWSSGVEVSSEENSYNLQKVAQPTITINEDNSVTITCDTDGATIYYKTGGDDPTTENATQGASIASILPSQGPIMAFAIKDGCIHSDIATESSIPAKTITVSSSNGSLNSANPIVYDGTAHEPAFTITDGETTISSEEYTSVYSDNTNAGTATITITDNENGDYNVSGSFTFTIAPKTLIITANDKEITYGDEPTNDGVTYDGFIEGESENTDGIFTGTLSYAYNYSKYGDVGSYAITPSGLSAANYSITFTPGVLTVNPREAGIEWGNTSLGYNGSAQVPIATATNVVNNDEVIVTVTGAQTDVGTDYTATATGLTGAKAGNYVLSSSNTTTTFSIGPGTFTPTVSIEGWTYGETSNAPSVSGNTSGGSITYSYSVKGEDNYSTDVPTDAGEYTLKVTIAAEGNYESVEVTKDFTISPKSIGDGNKTATGFTIELTSTGDLSAVKDGDTILTEEDYTLETTEDGQDKLVIVTGIGNYTGSAKGIYANPTFTVPDGEGAAQAAAVYKAKRDMAKPSDIKPYIVRKVNPTIGTLTISEIDYIPEDVPVLLLSDAEADGFVASPKEEATTAITDGAKNSNLLKVAPTGGVEVKAAQIYTFYQGEFVLTKAGTLSAGKFYLYNPNYTATSSAEEEQQQGGGNAPSLSTLRFVIEEDVMGVSDARSKMEDVRGDWYTLDGRKLSGKPTKAGLYIWNGRKTVIRRK